MNPCNDILQPLGITKHSDGSDPPRTSHQAISEIAFAHTTNRQNGKSIQLRANLLQLFQSNGWSIFLF